MIYRLLGHKRTALTGKEIEKLVREGLLSPDTKVTCEGEGFATFTFPTNSTGATYGFDMYPNGAPAGNKFQSATVNF